MLDIVTIFLLTKLIFMPNILQQHLFFAFYSHIS